MTIGKCVEGVNAISGAQFPALPWAKPVVWFALAVINWCSRSVAKSADIKRTKRDVFRLPSFYQNFQPFFYFVFIHLSSTLYFKLRFAYFSIQWDFDITNLYKRSPRCNERFSLPSNSKIYEKEARFWKSLGPSLYWGSTVILGRASKVRDLMVK